MLVLRRILRGKPRNEVKPIIYSLEKAEMKAARAEADKVLDADRPELPDCKRGQKHSRACILKQPSWQN